MSEKPTWTRDGKVRLIAKSLVWLSVQGLALHFDVWGWLFAVSSILPTFALARLRMDYMR